MLTPPPINWDTKPRAQAATSTPPPINWATKPRATTNKQPANSLSTPRRLIPIFFDPDYIGDLQEAVLRLTLTNPTFGYHKESEIESPPSQPPVANHEDHPDFDGQSLPPSPLVLSQNVVPLSKKKFYVITVGKCAGVFYGEWYVNLSIDGCFLNLTVLFRDNISHLVLGVSGAKFKGFATKEKATQAYLGAKNDGEVRIVRNPGDDEKYGPLFFAIQ
jgi:hypothetical protein